MLGVFWGASLLPYPLEPGQEDLFIYKCGGLEDHRRSRSETFCLVDVSQGYQGFQGTRGT